MKQIAGLHNSTNTLYSRTNSTKSPAPCAGTVNEHGVMSSGVPRNFVREGGVQQIQLRTQDRENGDLGATSGGGSPLVRGSGGSCNLVQEISFHIIKFS